MRVTINHIVPKQSMPKGAWRPRLPWLRGWKVWALVALVPVTMVGALFTFACLAHDPLHTAYGPSDATAGRIYAARHVIADYYAVHGRLPDDLQALLKATIATSTPMPWASRSRSACATTI